MALINIMFITLHQLISEIQIGNTKVTKTDRISTLFKKKKICHANRENNVNKYIVPF